MYNTFIISSRILLTTSTETLTTVWWHQPVSLWPGDVSCLLQHSDSVRCQSHGHRVTTHTGVEHGSIVNQTWEIWPSQWGMLVLAIVLIQTKIRNFFIFDKYISSSIPNSPQKEIFRLSVMNVSESLPYRSNIGHSFHTSKVKVATGQSILHAVVVTELSEAIVTFSGVSKSIGPRQIELDHCVRTVGNYLLC